MNAPAVIRDQQFHIAAILGRDAEGNGPAGGFAVARALRGRFDPMVHTISRQVDERVFHLFENTTVNLDIAALDRKLDFLALFPRKFARQAGKDIQQRRERLHDNLLHLVQKIVDHGGDGALIVGGGLGQFPKARFERLDKVAAPLQKFH